MRLLRNRYFEGAHSYLPVFDRATETWERCVRVSGENLYTD